MRVSLKNSPSRRSGLWFAAAALAASQAPSVAKAAGIDVPENGAGVLARGGTYSSQLDTAYALQFNPAGMTQINGLDVRIDFRWVKHDVSFARTGSMYGADPVRNNAPAFFAPGAAVAYHPMVDSYLKHFAFGVGAWGPPGVGKYSFADPAAVVADLKKQNPDAEMEDVDTAVGKKAPQRYSQINSDILIAYPSVGVAYSPIDKLSFGLTLQFVYADIAQALALAINDPAAKLLNDRKEAPSLDASVKLHSTQQPFSGHVRPTVVVGGAYQINKEWTVNASFRPTVYIEAPGEVDVELPSAIGGLAKVEGKDATLGLHLAPILRVGGSFKRGRIHSAAEFRWEGWSVNDQFKVATKVKIVQNGEGKDVGTLYIKNGWKDSFGGRIGGGYDFFRPEKDKFLLQGNLGVLFETNAVPAEQQALPFVSGNRAGLSAGVTVGYKGFGLTLAGMYYVPVTLDISNSQQAMAVSNPENVTPETQVIVGNGHYESKVWVAAIGLSYTGLGSSK